jgi:hypothetical protein
MVPPAMRTAFSQTGRNRSSDAYLQVTPSRTQGLLCAASSASRSCCFRSAHSARVAQKRFVAMRLPIIVMFWQIFSFGSGVLVAALALTGGAGAVWADAMLEIIRADATIRDLTIIS